jgi:sugar lactone lactonase YvrE
LYVLDSGTGHIRVFDDSGILVKTIGVPDAKSEDSPRAMLVTKPGGFALVPTSAKSKLRSFSETGLQVGEAALPTGLGDKPGLWPSAAVDSQSRLYIADPAGRRIVRLSADGKSATDIQILATPGGQPARPIAVAIGPGDALYAIDIANRTVYRFDANLQAEPILRVDPQDARLLLPSDVALDRDGNLWVADTGNRRVQKFSRDGRYLSRIGTEGVCMGLAMDEEGNAYISTADPAVLAAVASG